VVDTDVQSPGVHVLFGFDRDPPTPTINNYLYGGSSIVDVAHDVSRVVAGLAPGSLWLVPASMDINEIAKVLRTGYDVELLHEGFRDLVKGLGLDVLVIDTHPGLNEETLLSITVSDSVVLLLRPDKQDYQGAAVTVDVARRLQVPDLLMVVNKVPASVDRDSAAAQVAAAYDVEVAGVLPLSEDVAANASGGLFSVQYPDHPWSVALRGVASRLLAASVVQ
jgi:MinD-like ATPase involved in chromosome partitioning or flagellar assembly